MGSEFMDDDNSDCHSVKSESRAGSTRGQGIGGPRPLPSRNGSAEKLQDNSKHNAHGHDSPNVRPRIDVS